MKIDWKRKLTSRKLWLSVASFASMMMIFFGYAEDKATQVASLIMAGASIVAYVIGEGLADSNSYIEYSNETIEEVPKEEKGEE